MVLIVRLICGLAFVLVAVYYDFTTDKIPNSLNICGALCGIILALIYKGLSGGLESLAGIFIPIAILFVLHRLRFLGAGDIKLFAMAGSYLGFGILYVILFSFVFGGFISLFRIILNQIDKKNKKHIIHFSLEIFLGFVLLLLKYKELVL